MFAALEEEQEVKAQLQRSNQGGDQYLVSLERHLSTRLGRVSMSHCNEFQLYSEEMGSHQRQHGMF